MMTYSDLSSETKKSIVSERKALDSNCRDNNDEFKVEGSQSSGPEPIVNMSRAL